MQYCGCRVLLLKDFYLPYLLLWLNLSHLFQLFKLQETGSSVPLQFGVVGIHLTGLKETQGVVIPLKSFRIVPGLEG